MIAIIVILTVLCILLLVRNLSHRNNIRWLKKQVEQITNEDTNLLLTVEAPEEEMEELFLSINKVLSVTRRRQIYYINKEKELRKQISNISHDLRTPLTSILGYLELVRDGDISEEERKEYLLIIEKRAKILQELISGVYDLSRMEENKFVLEEEQINVSQVLYEVLALYYNEFEKLEYDCDVEITENVPSIFADRKALVRIYSNLLQNVLRHGDGKLYVQLSEEDGQIVTKVCNSTKEIKKEDLPKLFDRFYMADRLKTGQNTGLGLAIVKKLTEMMGGQISAMMEQEMFSIVIIWPVQRIFEKH